MSFARKQSSVRLENAKEEFRGNITGVIFSTGFLLSIYSVWGNDLNRITNIDMSTAAAAAVCFLIGAYRIGLIRR